MREIYVFENVLVFSVAFGFIGFFGVHFLNRFLIFFGGSRAVIFFRFRIFGMRAGFGI